MSDRQLLEAQRSNCCKGLPVDIYWRYCPAEEDEGHIVAIVQALFDAIAGADRVWNPFSGAIVRAEFTNRLRKAAQGDLVPVDHLKSLRGGRDNLFEIRWLDINVTERSGGRIRHVTTGARLIHAEPLKVSVGMVGLLAHEKGPGTAASAQDERIDQAEVVFHGGYDDTWSISLRGTSA